MYEVRKYCCICIYHVFGFKASWQWTRAMKKSLQDINNFSVAAGGSCKSYMDIYQTGTLIASGPTCIEWNITTHTANYHKYFSYVGILLTVGDFHFWWAVPKCTDFGISFEDRSVSSCTSLYTIITQTVLKIKKENRLIEKILTNRQSIVICCVTSQTVDLWAAGGSFKSVDCKIDSLTFINLLQPTNLSC